MNRKGVLIYAFTAAFTVIYIVLYKLFLQGYAAQSISKYGLLFCIPLQKQCCGFLHLSLSESCLK